MAESMKDRKESWFHMTPTDDFIDLMLECEEEGWDWETFLKKVEAHFRKVHPETNKGKKLKPDSVRQKCVDVNDKMVEHDAPAIAVPHSGGGRVNWKDRARQRRNSVK